ncbi:DUF305 domain-containing protein [Streptomyces sp. NBC_00250]|uniref:DUF305 domain-containing protein n=1 Tax=Streptomyces sp. NBC_00250 TaxID=2903641 RepID=UPI002E2A46F9|nr:DUF305 domain-containing protein [Streptomyces sp. NBC_00250]
MQLRRHVLILRTAAALLAALPAVGCTQQPTVGPPRTALFNATDTAWIQLMIPMDERAEQLTALAASRTADPALAGIATGSEARLKDELTRLRALLKLSGVPDTRPHEGHDMPGMVSLDVLDRVTTTTGKELDRLFTDSMRAHLAQTRTLCAGERASGQSDAATDLASAIERSAADQLALLNAPR